MSRRILLLLPPPPSAAAAAAVDPRNSHLDRALAVSFAALFSLSLAYLLLSSLRHCRRRRHRGTSSDRIPGKTEATDAACSAQLQAIPVTTVRKNTAAAAATNGDIQVEEEESTCAVCLGQYNEGEEIRTMPLCGHVFHRECIDGWLIRRSSFCPVCRGRVIQRSAEPAITSCWVETERVGPVPLLGASAVSTPIVSVL